MSLKRNAHPAFVQNPFIKRRNLQWTVAPPATSLRSEPNLLPDIETGDSTPAAVEAGLAEMQDHLTYFVSHLSKYTVKPVPPATPLLSTAAYSSLYKSCHGNPQGNHFVIHQHDHPVAGTHYDLRLQINETSSVSWAIMYGLPGDPNSVRLNRNATETRIHCLWNHLIETGSSHTGSLLIWDTGTYTILPRRSKHSPAEDPSSPPSSPSFPSGPYQKLELSQQRLLHNAFQARKIRIQLHGTKLPDPYILNLRLTKREDAVGRAKSGRKPQTRKSGRLKAPEAPPQPETTTDEHDGSADEEAQGVDEDAHLVPTEQQTEADVKLSATEREIRELEDEQVRNTNAYTGATNTIGSVYQRKWYLSLDRAACGFVKTRVNHKVFWEKAEPVEGSETGQTEPGQDDGDQSAGKYSYPFYVRGASDEKSVITGRKGSEILRDEGVTDFVQRKGWTAVLN